MSKHLAILKGPQGERINVICNSEAEARALETADAERRAVVADLEDEDDEEGELCTACGQRKRKAIDNVYKVSFVES